MQAFLAIIFGIIFGIANVIPGVSGGTMMVVMGCYDKVCGALALDFKHIKSNLNFLIPFGIGAISGIIGFSFVITYLFENFPVPTYLFFIGLILGSLPQIFRNATAKEKFKIKFIVPMIIALIAVVGITVFQQSHEEEDYTVKRTRTETGFAIEFTNNTSQEIGSVYFEFPEGAITAAGGAELFYNESFSDKINTLFGNGGEHSPNAIRPAGVSVVGANKSFSFTYNSSQGQPVELEAIIKYNMSSRLFSSLLFGGFIAAVAMIIPGVSGSFMMVLFGIYATVIGAVKDFNLVIILPAAIGIIFGVILGAKMIKWLLDRHNGLTYSIIIGLVAGSVYAILPPEIEFNLQLIIGIGVMIVAGAVSLAIGMEKKSNDEMVKTAGNLK
ncbi:MAG: DUF368 domain-containing protein [Eubacterium sp.]|jgi:putative membrane protein|nr:DUF368 domain-containing protein [Eubacterium sp.]